MTYLSARQYTRARHVNHPLHKWNALAQPRVLAHPLTLRALALLAVVRSCLAAQNIMEMSTESARVFDHRVSRSRSAMAPADRCACAAARAVHRKHTAPASAPPPFATSRRLFPAAFVERASLHIGCAAAHPLTGDGVAAARVLADCARAEAPPRDRAGRLCRRERHVPIFCTFVPYSGYAAARLLTRVPCAPPRGRVGTNVISRGLRVTGSGRARVGCATCPVSRRVCHVRSRKAGIRVCVLPLPLAI